MTFACLRVPRLRVLLLAPLAALVSLPLHGQASSPAASSPGVDVAVTYAALHAAHTVDTATFWLQGGAVDLHAPLYRGLGAVANVSGYHVSHQTPLVAPLDIVTAVFGLRYTVTGSRHRQRFLGRTSFFLEGLGGEANGFHSIFTTGSGPVNGINGTTDSANSLAVQAGGGLDLWITPRLGVRAIQADYVRTQLPNGGTNVQDNLRLAAGLVFRFHR